MKKITLGILSIFVLSLFLVSCSSDNQVLSSFSKRKYLKNFKEKKVKYEDNTEDYDLASNKQLNVTDIESDFTFNSPTVIKEISQPIIISKKEEKVIAKSIKNEVKNWNKFNREMSDNFFAYNDKAGFMHEKYNKVSSTAKQVDDIVLVILGIFIPPLAVYLYEDAITANFWVDLLLTLLIWVPGIIFAMLVMFADVSV